MIDQREYSEQHLLRSFIHTSSRVEYEHWRDFSKTWNKFSESLKLDEKFKAGRSIFKEHKDIWRSQYHLNCSLENHISGRKAKKSKILWVGQNITRI